MANVKSVNIVTKSISRVPVFDNTGEKKIGTMNLVWKVSQNGSDLDELDPTDDFNDLDTTHDTGSEHEPDVLDVLIAREENPPEDVEGESTSLAGAVGKYENCTGFDEDEFDWLYGKTIYDPISQDYVWIFDEPVSYADIMAYDTIAEPPVRTKAIITSDDMCGRDEGSPRAMYNEQNNRRRQACFTHRHYATVRGAQMAEDGFFVPRQQR